MNGGASELRGKNAMERRLKDTAAGNETGLDESNGHIFSWLHAE